MDTNKIKISIALNTIIAISTIAITVLLVFNLPFIHSENAASGADFFRMFTNNSNVFMCIVSIVTITFFIKLLKGKIQKFPKLLILFNLMSTACLTLTFLVVALFLAPNYVIAGKSYFKLFSNTLLFFHFINPILAIINFVWLLNYHKINFKEKLLCLIPTFIYVIIYITNVVILQTWPDFYGFTFGGKYQFIPIVIIVMLLFTFLIILLLSTLHNKVISNENLK